MESPASPLAHLMQLLIEFIDVNLTDPADPAMRKALHGIVDSALIVCIARQVLGVKDKASEKIAVQSVAAFLKEQVAKGPVTTDTAFGKLFKDWDVRGILALMKEAEEDDEVGSK
jgi:hypothetical protein